MKRRQNRITLACLLLVFSLIALGCSGSADAVSTGTQNWELAYAHDNSGTITPDCEANVTCSVEYLIDAIAKGAEVRISVHNHLMTPPTTYYQTLSQVWISPDEPRVGGKRHVPLTDNDPETIWATSRYYINSDVIATYSGGMTPIEDKTNNFAMEWFVKR